MPAFHRLRSFFRRHSLLILWLIVIFGGIGAFTRSDSNASHIRQLTKENRALTLAIKRGDEAQQRALCASRVESRTNLKELLEGIVADVIPPGRPLRFELERRINETFGSPPEDCT